MFFSIARPVPAILAWMISGISMAADPVDTVRLSTEKIRTVFANVRDDARVQDAVGTIAVNFWYADGSFTNAWSNEHGSGTVQGHWRAQDDKRCIVITAGLADRIGKESCSPVLRRGKEYLSINPDGSIHGIHRLTPITGMP